MHLQQSEIIFKIHLFLVGSYKSGQFERGEFNQKTLVPNVVLTNSRLMEARKEIKVAATVHNQLGEQIMEVRGSEEWKKNQIKQNPTVQQTIRSV